MHDNWCTPDLCDDHDDALVLDFPWWSFGREKCCGEVIPVVLDRNNQPLKAALEEPGEDRVLLVWAGGLGHGAVVGDRVASRARDRGWSGLVVLGRVRDTSEIKEIDIGVFSLGKTPRKLMRQIPSLPAELETLFERASGGVLYADDDGVIILPRQSS